MNKLIFSFLLLVSALALSAQPNGKPLENVNAFKEKVQQESGSIRTIESAFEQEKHLAVLNEPSRSSGTFYYSHEGNVRWEYREPTQQSIILHQGNVTMITDGKIEKTNARAAKAYKRMNALMADVIHGNVFGDESFDYAFFQDIARVRVVMTPRDASIAAHLEEITLFFNSAFRVEQLVMTEPGGDFTLYRFSDQRYNQGLPEGVFRGEVLE